MAAGHSYRVENILVAAGEDLEQYQVLRAWKWEADAKELVEASAMIGGFLKGQRRRDKVDLKHPSPKPDGSCLGESLSFDIFAEIEAGFVSLLNQGLSFGK